MFGSEVIGVLVNPFRGILTKYFESKIIRP